MAFIYRTRHYLKVGDTLYEPGDEIPEAASWWNLRSYVRSGRVVMVQTDVQQWFGAKQKIPLPPDEAVLDKFHHHHNVLEYQHTDGWGAVSEEPEPENGDEGG